MLTNTCVLSIESKPGFAGQGKRWCRGFSPYGFNVSVTTNNGIEAMNNSLKSFYLKISGTKTVSSLVEMIITEFIPEQLLSYAKLNYTYSSEHKVYSADVPEFLWDRPRTFVQHCLKSIEAGAHYTSQNVQEQSKGVYKVQSEQPCDWYSVDLGDKDRLPSCECRSFKSSFLPCKHFFAVFKHTDSSWYSLCPDYINSPYVTLDSDVVSSQKQLQVKEVIDKSKTVHPVAKDSLDIQCLKMDVEANGVSTAQSDLREKLKILLDLSYLCTDLELLRNATAVIDELAGKMKCSVPKEDALPLLSKKDDVKLKLRLLPTQKRKGKLRAKRRKIEKRNGDTVDQSGSLKENSLTDCATIVLPEAETLLAELNKHENVEVDSGGILSVCGQVLGSCDFETLKHPHWLNDKVINAYLDTLKLENNTKANAGYHCFNISTYMPLLWECDRFDSWMFEKVVFSQMKWLFLPVHVRGNHWVLLVADVPKMEVSIMDSLSGNNDIYIDMWRFKSPKKACRPRPAGIAHQFSAEQGKNLSQHV